MSSNASSSALAGLLVLRAFLPVLRAEAPRLREPDFLAAFPAYPRRKARQRMAYHRPAGLALFWGKGKFYRIDLFLVQQTGQGQVPEPVPALRAGRVFPAQPRNIPVPHMPGSFPPGLRAAEPGHPPGLAGWVPAAEPGQAVLPAGVQAAAGLPAVPAAAARPAVLHGWCDTPEFWQSFRCAGGTGPSGAFERIRFLLYCHKLLLGQLHLIAGALFTILRLNVGGTNDLGSFLLGLP